MHAKNAVPAAGSVGCQFHSVRIHLVKTGDLRALATVAVGDALFVTGVRVLQRPEGLAVRMASKQNRQGKYEDTYYPQSATKRAELEAAVLAAYQAELDGGKS
jgi:DNA-binding cell septation regulator SpoVG